MTEEMQKRLDAMPLEEKFKLMASAGGTIALSDNTIGVEEYFMAAEDEPQEMKDKRTTCYPHASAIAATWSTETAEQIGKAQAQDARRNGIAGITRPAMNIKRHPLNGRNFEYYSEDPVLSGELAGSYVLGMQSEGVAACVKHFCANNHESERMVTNEIISERALREIYLANFEIAIKKANPWTIMTSYNQINGEYVNSSKHIITDILRGEWGYNGMVMTDAGAVHHNKVETHNNDVDTELNAYEEHAGELQDAYYTGKISIETIDREVARILSLGDRINHNEKIEVDHAAQHALAVEAAADSIVLLKNEAATLPLDKNQKVLVIGDLACTPKYCGGGSGHSNARVLESTKACIEDIAGADHVEYERGYDNLNEADDSMIAQAVECAKNAQTVLLFVGIPYQEAIPNEHEGNDRADMELSRVQKELIEKVQQVNQNVILVVNAGSPVNLTPYVAQARAILFAYTAGEGMGKALAQILYGEAEPGGRLPETFPCDLRHTPAYNNYPGMKTPTHDVVYGEGIYVGYRWYESRNLPVLYPFGYGMSYTRFEMSDLRLSHSKMQSTDVLEASVKVKNVGTRKGSEVVQIYVRDVECTMDRPEKELKAFQKVTLEPGEETVITFELGYRAFAFWSEDAQKWVVESGEFEILAGNSSANTPLKQSVMVESTDHVIHFNYMTAIQWIETAPNLEKALEGFSDEIKKIFKLGGVQRNLTYNFPCYRLLSPYSVTSVFVGATLTAADLDRLLYRLNTL